MLLTISLLFGVFSIKSIHASVHTWIATNVIVTSGSIIIVIIEIGGRPFEMKKFSSELLIISLSIQTCFQSRNLLMF